MRKRREAIIQSIYGLLCGVSVQYLVYILGEIALRVWWLVTNQDSRPFFIIITAIGIAVTGNDASALTLLATIAALIARVRPAARPGGLGGGPLGARGAAPPGRGKAGAPSGQPSGELP